MKLSYPNVNIIPHNIIVIYAKVEMLQSVKGNNNYYFGYEITKAIKQWIELIAIKLNSAITN